VSAHGQVSNSATIRIKP